MKDKEKNWFSLITDQVLERSGPAKEKLIGADIYAGQMGQKPGDQLTEDMLDKAERSKK